MAIKRILWIGGSRQSIRDFPDEARNIAGNMLWMIQRGRQPEDTKPLKSVGVGAFEIRIHKPHEHRVIVVAKFPEAVYVLHCFAKKTQKISQQDLITARTAYAEMQKIRQKQSET